MGYKVEKSNFRVEVTPRADGDYGSIRISGGKYDPEREERAAKELAEDIRRHVDRSLVPSYGNRGIDVVWDSELVCEHCGSPWTEGKDNNHNGGCCDKDCEVYYAENPET